VCPYASTTPYTLAAVPYGTLACGVLNELRHPDTVASSIDLLVEVFCCDDFEMSVPVASAKIGLAFNPSLAPTASLMAGTLPSQVAEKVDHTEELGQAALQSETQNDLEDAPEVAKPQGAVSDEQMIDSTVPHPPEPTIGTAKMLNDQLASSRFAIGEKIVSFRQLLKRATPWINRLTTTFTSVYYFPDTIGTPYNQTAQGFVFPGVNAITESDLYNSIVPCYAYYRGSTRVKYYNRDTTTNASANVRTTYVPDSTDPTQPWPYMSNVDPSIKYAAYPVVVSPWVVAPVQEVQMPYYNRFHMSLTTSIQDDFSLGANNARHQTKPRCQAWTTVVDSTTALNSSVFLRSIGEDYSLGFWTGALVTTMRSTISNAVQPSPF